MRISFDTDQMWNILIWNHDLEEKKTVPEWFWAGVGEATAEVMRTHNVAIKPGKKGRESTAGERREKVELADFLSMLADKELEITSTVEFGDHDEVLYVTDFRREKGKN